MIVREIMTTKLITVKPDDTIGHAVRLLRQYQFHHLPVVQQQYSSQSQQTTYQSRPAVNIFKGLLTTQDLDMAVALAQRQAQDNPTSSAWQEQHIDEIMQRPPVWVTPTTSAAAAAQLLVERGMNCLPVIEPAQDEDSPHSDGDILVGLLTRSDILLAFARLLGAYEPGTQITLPLPAGRMAPLASALLAADELHVSIHTILSGRATPHNPQNALLRLGTINPAPFFRRLDQEGISYTRGNAFTEGQTHDRN